MAEPFAMFAIATVVQMAISYLFPAEGPRLKDLRVSASTYGAVIPQVFGTVRVAGNMIWSGGIREVKTKVHQGKGGSYYNQYTYFADFAMAFCLGPVTSIRRVWGDGKLFFSGNATGSINAVTKASEGGFAGTFSSAGCTARVYLGGPKQNPDPLIESVKGVGNTPAYRDLCYVVFDDFPLADWGNRIPQMAAEVYVGPLFAAFHETPMAVGDGSYAAALDGATNLVDWNRNCAYTIANTGLVGGQPGDPVTFKLGIARHDLTSGLVDKFVSFETIGLGNGNSAGLLGLTPDGYIIVEYLKGLTDDTTSLSGAIVSKLDPVAFLKTGSSWGSAWDVSQYDVTTALVMNFGFPQLGPFSSGFRVTSYPHSASDGVGVFEIVIGEGIPACMDPYGVSGANGQYFLRICAPTPISTVIPCPLLAGGPGGFDLSNVDLFRTWDLINTNTMTAISGVVPHSGYGFGGVSTVARDYDTGKPIYYVLTEEMPGKQTFLDGEVRTAGYLRVWSLDEKSITWNQKFNILPDAHGASYIQTIFFVWDSSDPGLIIAYTTLSADLLSRKAFLTKWSEDTETFVWEKELSDPVTGLGAVNIPNNGPSSAKISNGQLAFVYPSGTLDGPAGLIHLIDTITGEWVKVTNDPCDDALLDATQLGPTVTESVIFDGQTGYPINSHASPIGPFHYNSQSLSIMVPVSHVNFSPGGYLYGPRHLTEMTSVGDIVERILRIAGMTSAEFDLTPLYDIPVHGYGFANLTDVKAVVEELRHIYLFDLFESDGRIVARVRGDSSTGDLIVKQQVLGSSGEAIDYWQETRIQEADIPEKLTLVYMNLDKDFETASAASKRIQNPVPSMFSRQQVQMQANIVMTAKEAKDRMNNALYAQWLERTKHTTKLPWAFLALDPSDLVEVRMDDGRDYLERLHQTELGSDLSLAITSFGQDSGAYISDVTAADGGGGPTQQTLPYAAITEAIILNTPLLRDADDQGGAVSVYYGGVVNISPYTFAGAAVFRSTDGSNFNEAFGLSQDMEYGIIQGTLAAPPGGPFIPDVTNTLTIVPGVKWFNLSPVTEAELLQGANPVVIGNEVIQFRDVVHNTDGTWTVSHLLRGRRGTEWACGSHVPTERFIALSPSWLSNEVETLDAAGQLRYFKSVSTGRAISTASVKSITYWPRDLMPYSPVQITRTIDPASGNITVKWVRRDRLGSGWLDGGSGSIPLHETSESYELYLMNAKYDGDASIGAPPSSFLKKVTQGSPSYTWPVSEQIAANFDFANQSLYIAVFQISSKVGRGFPGVIGYTPSGIPITPNPPPTQSPPPPPPGPTPTLVLIQSGGSSTVTEGGATDTFTVVLSNQPSAKVTVTVTGNADVTVSPGTLSFTSTNWDTPQTITLTAVDDALVEGFETTSVTLTTSSVDVNFNGLSTAPLSVGVIDNDSAPALPPSSTPALVVAVTGGSTNVTEGGATDSFTVKLNTQPTADVTVTVAGNADVTVSPTSLTFTSVTWDATQGVTVTAVDDIFVEGTESVTVTFATSSSDTNYNSLSTPALAVTVFDNDVAAVAPAVIVTQTGGSTTVTEGGATDTFSVKLSVQPTANVIVAVNGNADVSVSPTSLTFTVSNWNTAQNVTVTAVDDTIVEGFESTALTFTVTSSDAGYNGLTVNSVTVGVTDNDTAPAPTVGGAVNATSAYDFLSRIGVNSHLDRAGHYQNFTQVKACMDYLGVKIMRDVLSHNPGDPYYDSFATMASYGMRFIAEIGGPGDFTGFATRCAALETSYPGSILAVEGPNEITDYANGGQYMRDLSAAVRANSVIASKKIINLSISGVTPSYYSQVGDVSAYCDYGNSHIYYNGGMPSWGWNVGDTVYYWTNWLASARISVPGKPVCVTETGSNTFSSSIGVSEATQARQLLNMYMVAWKNSAPFTIMYELIESIDDTSTVEHYFGLFHGDYSAKPAATALKNHIAILSNGTVGGQSGALSYSVSGLSSVGSHLCLRKNATTYSIVIWEEPDIWDEVAHSAIAPPTSHVTVTLAAACTAARVYDPLVGTAPTSTVGAVTQIAVNVVDHPIIIDVDVASTGTTATGGGSSGSVAAIDMDFIGGTYTGATLADLGSPTVAADGLHVTSTITLGGNINTLLSGAAATVILELGPATTTVPAATVLKNGSTVMLQMTGFGSIGGGGITASVGFGGFKGLSRVGIAYDSSGASIGVNDGVIQTTVTPLTLSSTFVLPAGTIIRRLKVSNSRLSNSLLKAETAIQGRAFVNPPATALTLPTAVQSFFDDFTSNTLRHRSGSVTASPVTTNNQALVALYDTTGNWMPRYVSFCVDATGSGFNSINGEWQKYNDPDYPGNWNPFSFSGSVLTIKADKLAGLTGSEQALLGNRFAWGADTGVQWPIVSGCLTTAGKFSQKFGYFEARIKTSQIHRAWPAFWLLPTATLGSEAELDVMEQIGVTGRPGYDTSAIHYNSYGINQGIENEPAWDWSADFHTYGALWQSGVVKFYRDGLLIGQISTGGNFDNSAMYMLLNLAVGGSWPGDPDSTTYSALPTTMQVDYVRVFVVN